MIGKDGDSKTETRVFQWKSDQYIKFINERTQPSVDLANRIGLDAPAEIIDIGCGPGNSTRALANRFPRAHIIGADNSENMLEKARSRNPEFEFIRFDASRDFTVLNRQFDIVFSNACIQWVPDHPSLIKNMLGTLRAGGVLAVQIPMNYKEPIHRIIGEVSSSAKWRGKFDKPRVFYNLTQDEYFDLLSKNASDFSMWETVYCHRMPSHESIMEWYRGSGLRPYLAALSSEECKEFEREIYNEVVKAYPVRENGEIIFRFPRFFFTAIP